MREKYGGAYNACYKNKWLSDLFTIEKKPNGYWNNLENCKNAALDCKNVRDFIKKYGGAYNVCRKKSWVDQLVFCGNDKNKKKLIKFIEQAKLVHEGENLDYSKAEYINNRTPLCIIDHDLKEDGTEYGEFWQTPSNHLKGQSHPLKRGKKIASSKKSSQEDFIERAKKVHCNENLDYSKVEYVNMHTKVLIIDHDLDENGNEYGEYWQEPNVHLKGCCHPRKGILKQKQSRLLNQQTNNNVECFYIYAKKEIYNYFKDLVEIECHNKTVLDGEILDFYFPNENFGIQYNTLFDHGEIFHKDKWYHLNQTKLANEKGIKLIQIYEDEYVEHKDIVINKINHLLHIKEDLPKVMGRKCVVKEIEKEDAEKFLNEYHIQGYASTTVALGAFYDGILIGVMTFKQENIEGEWDLNRFASNYHYICQGIGGKLFKYFVKHYNPLRIKSFADRRWTVDLESNVYTKLGFKFEKMLKPEYRYYKESDGCKRQHKFGFRKQILNKKYNLPLSLTESQMVKLLKYDRIWDCGLIKYVWKKEEE